MAMQNYLIPSLATEATPAALNEAKAKTLKTQEGKGCHYKALQQNVRYSGCCKI